jgi:acyl carrier protein
MTDTLEIVSEVVSEVGKEAGYDGLSNVDRDTELLGGSSEIDSLTVVQIVAELERVAEERFGKAVVLADDRAMSRRNSPFRTVGTLADLLAERLRE